MGKYIVKNNACFPRLVALININTLPTNRDIQWDKKNLKYTLDTYPTFSKSKYTQIIIVIIYYDIFIYYCYYKVYITAVFFKCFIYFLTLFY